MRRTSAWTKLTPRFARNPRERLSFAASRSPTIRTGGPLPRSPRRLRQSSGLACSLLAFALPLSSRETRRSRTLLPDDLKHLVRPGQAFELHLAPLTERELPRA